MPFFLSKYTGKKNYIKPIMRKQQQQQQQKKSRRNLRGSKMITTTADDDGNVTFKHQFNGEQLQPQLLYHYR